MILRQQIFDNFFVILVDLLYPIYVSIAENEDRDAQSDVTAAITGNRLRAATHHHRPLLDEP